jgi:hypothetical protein
MIAWTPALRDLVFATRAAPNPAYLQTQLSRASAADRIGDPVRAHAELRDWGHWARPKQLLRIADGLGKTAPELRPLVERALEEYERREPAPGSLDADVEAALVALELGDTWRAVPFWYAKEGLSFAIRALVRVHAYLPSNHRHGYGSTFWIEETWAGAHLVDASTAWHVVRALACAAAEPDYAAAKAVASDLRAVVPASLRATLAFAFPDEPTWAAEAAAEALRDPERWPGDPRPLAATCDVRAAEALVRAKPRFGWDEAQLATVLARHGEEGAAVLGALLDVAENAEQRKRVAKVLAHVVAPSAAMVFRTWLGNKAIAPIATKWFKAHPEYAAAALEPIAAGRSKLAASAALALEATGAAAPTVTEVDPATLPPILAEPPWLARRAAAVVAVEPPNPTPTELALPAELVAAVARERAQWEEERTEGDWVKQGATDELLVKWIGGRYQMGMSWLVRVRDTAAALALWEEKPGWYWTSAADALPSILAAHGVAAVPVLLRWARDRVADAITGLRLVVAPAVAPLLADARLRTKTVRAECDAWLEAHPAIAAEGLIADAVGTPGPRRSAAEAALSWLRREGHGAAVDEVAARFGPAAAAAVAAIDPRNTFPAKLPKLPDFARAEALPPVALVSGGPIGPRATERLVTMLAFDDPAAPYVGLDEVRAACTAESLRELAWALFERWLAASAPPKESWALHALGAFGDDEIVRRLAPLLRAWPKEKAIARTQTALEVLGRIGTELALLHVDALAHELRFASVKEKAGEIIAEIGRRRGLSPDALADRLTPTLGLDADGSRTLDFGPRTFRVGFDQHLTPIVRDERGAVLRSLPRAAKTDDATKAKAAHATWKALVADARAIAARQIARLERAMLEERSWTPDEHRRFLREHPLLRHVAQRLVWSTTRAGARRFFRVAEDGTLAGPDDARLELDAEEQIAVAHPLRMAPAVRDRFRELFVDYELLQPFPQLERELPTIEDPQAALAQAGELDRGRLQRLRERGFVADGERWLSYLVKRLRTPSGDVAVVIVGLTPGYAITDAEPPPQTLTGLSLRVGPDERPLAILGDIGASELLRELIA